MADCLPTKVRRTSLSENGLAPCLLLPAEMVKKNPSSRSKPQTSRLQGSLPICSASDTVLGQTSRSNPCLSVAKRSTGQPGSRYSQRGSLFQSKMFVLRVSTHGYRLPWASFARFDLIWLQVLKPHLPKKTRSTSRMSLTIHIMLRERDWRSPGIFGMFNPKPDIPICRRAWASPAMGAEVRAHPSTFPSDSACIR